MRINLKEKLCTKIWGRVYNPTFRRAALPLGVRPFGESDLKRNTLHERQSFEGLQELVCPPDFKEIAGV